MAEDPYDIFPLLQGMAMFRGLNRNQIHHIADMLEVTRLETGECLFSQGDRGDNFYIVAEGRISVRVGKVSHQHEIALLRRGDHFGEEALLYNQPRNATVTAVDPTVLLRMNEDSFKQMLKQYPSTHLYLKASMESRHLARKKSFQWLAEGETIYLMTRKHVAYLYYRLIGPILMGWFGLGFLYAGTVLGAASVAAVSTWLGVLLLVLAVAWAVWAYVDWGNDYYIVTNQRVVWLEKVVALYESRQEAPLSTVLTVGISRDQLGRMLGFGDVIVRTYTGQIVMRHVGLADQLVGLIEEQLGRDRRRERQVEKEKLELAIRGRLGLPVEELPATEKQEPEPAPVLAERRHIGNLFSDFFKVRYEEGGVVTFRKHWILLLQGVWAPTLGLLSLAALFILSLMGIFTFLSLQVMLLVVFTVGFLLSIFWIYQYVDWRNDIYQLTNEQIIDIYRKPLGSEDKKAAPLENILSLENRRIGLFGVLLNYGNVTAMVGAAKFVFEGVYDPPAVEQEIFRRINERKQRLKESEEAKERERVADWMVAYHRQAEIARRMGNNPPNLD